MSTPPIARGLPRVVAERRDVGQLARAREERDAQRREEQAAIALRSWPYRAALVAVTALTLLTLLAVADAPRWSQVVMVALAAVGVPVWLRPRLRTGSGAGAVERVARQQVAGTVLCLVGLPIALPAIDGVPIERFALLYAFVIVTVLYTAPWRSRAPLAVGSIASLAALLWFGGVRDPATLLLHLGGAAMVFAATVRLAVTLATQAVAADANRESAALRARLLATLLATSSLAPREVLRASVDGLLELGFATASIRELDHDRRVARLVEGVARGEVVLPSEIAFAGTAIPDVITRRGPLLIQDAAADPRLHGVDHPVDAALFLPLFDDEGITAVLSGETIGRPISDDEVAAAQVLAEQADRALRRARAYEADQRTVDQLRLVDLRIQDFVSTLSHELRTPLTVIQGLGQTLSQRWDQLAIASRQDLLRRIDANADRLATMLSSLIDSSALESGNLVVRTEPVSLRALVGEVLHRAAGVTSVHPVRVAIEADTLVQVDPALLAHVVENLLTNVEKHTPAGTRIEIRATPQDDTVEVAISDDGPGIATEDLPHVFDRFYRGGLPDTRATSGLGLGLALAQDVIAAHGGQLQVASSEGEGTTFSFDLPRPAAPPGR
ncbi:MAG: GAF domain-containing protein [Nitriliruptoraceae bacterium]|nr:GAF domain-containing protein [Nitriliruptoraceae bacterium]